MKIAYLGSGEFGVPCLDAIAASGHELSFVVTQSPHPAGRGRKQRPTPVAVWAKENSVPFFEMDNVNAPESIEKIASCGPDLLVVIAFGQKISNELINLPPKGAVNVHASLLPKYRGAAPINWAIINGEKQTGVSIIALAEKMDAGDILAQAQTDIASGETAGQLHDRLAGMAAPLLLETIEKIAAGSIVYTPQDHSRATRAPKLKKSDGFLDFSESAETIAQKIRGFRPWPGATVLYVNRQSGKKERVTIADAKIVETKAGAALQPGVLNENLEVVCGEGALKITRIKPAGKSVMDFKAFVNGRSTKAGDSFAEIRQ